MLIYKYVDAQTLGLIVQSQRIMFTHPADFNDPFDRPRVSRSAYPFGLRSLFDGKYMTPAMLAEQADKAWGQCAVSSFTRTYDNALMWAHYADKHRGAVIEIDAEIAGLTSKSFLIPAQFGSVIYMKRPNTEYKSSRRPSDMGAHLVQAGENRLQIDNYERLQRLFLTKGLPWAYEEEIRVVCEPFRYYWNEKNECIVGTWKRIIKADGCFGYGYNLQAGSITRVFTGLRFKDPEQLDNLAAATGFRVVRSDPSHRDDYEVHFHSDEYTAVSSD